MKAQKFGMGFGGGGGGLFLVQGFFGVLLEALGIFLGFDFGPNLVTPVAWNSEYPPGELPKPDTFIVVVNCFA